MANESAEDTADPDDTLLDGREPYSDSDEDTIRMLYDFEAGCLTELAKGNDISRALTTMAGVANRSEVARRSYADIMERLLPLIGDEDLHAENSIRLSQAYLLLKDESRATEIMDGLVAAYPDPATHWGRVSRYTQAIQAVQLNDNESAAERLEELWRHADLYEMEESRRIGWQLASVHKNMGNWQDVLRVGLPSLPTNLDARDFSFYAVLNVATAYLELEDYVEAAQYFQQLAAFLEEVEPGSPLLQEPFPHMVETGLRLAHDRIRFQGEQGEIFWNRVQKESNGVALGQIAESTPDVPMESDSSVQVGSLGGPAAALILDADLVEEESEARRSFGIIGVAAAIGFLMAALGMTGLFFGRKSVDRVSEE